MNKISKLEVTDVFNEKGLLSDAIENYEYRHGQETYSSEIKK